MDISKAYENKKDLSIQVAKLQVKALHVHDKLEKINDNRDKLEKTITEQTKVLKEKTDKITKTLKQNPSIFQNNQTTETN